MFSRSKNKGGKDKPQLDENAKKDRLKQFLIDVPGMPGASLGNEDSDECDSDLEAELLALTQGISAPVTKAKKGKRTENINKMVEESMKNDISDDEDFDEDDPELLAELSALAAEEPENEIVTSIEPTNKIPSMPDTRKTPPVVTRPAPVVPKPTPAIVRPPPLPGGPNLTALLRERIIMYEEAEKNATDMGETSRAKRFNRGLGTLQQMFKTVQAGRTVKEEDIPPAVLVSSSRASSKSDLVDVNIVSTSISSPNLIPSEVIPFNNQNNESNRPDILTHAENIDPPTTAIASPSVPVSLDESSVNQSSTVIAVTQRQVEYKSLALEAKKNGNIEEAMTLLKIAKQMQPMVDAAKEGKEIDLSSLPALPSKSVMIPMTHEPSIVQPTEEKQQAASASSSKPLTTLDALQQRMDRFVEQRDKAKSDGNARKERMNQRIVKQFQEAITQVKAGRLMDFSELPTPPGFPPIPEPGTVQNSTPPVAPASSLPAAQPSKSNIETDKNPLSVPSEGPKQKQLKPNPLSAGSSSKVEVNPNVRNAPKSRVERQLSVLQKRQQQFKEAALDAKKKGEIEQAKEYLRNSKGFDQLILATQGGLPVDMNTAPVPPQEIIASFSPVSDFEVIAKEDCEILPTKTAADMSLTYTKLENDLISQIKMCARTREHFKAVGDVASANRFEQLILHSKKDLDSVRAAFRRGDSPPKFHYETRSFTMIQCNTDLTDSDLEFVVMRGINYNVSNPKELDTYVKIEFPYPTDSPPQDKTDVVKDTNCPEYNHKFVFSIDRKLRAVTRIFRRQSIKCQIINKGSWYHRDSVMGSVKIPLVHLENKCIHHESYDLLDDRKKMVGGKLEAKIRVRNPILTKQLEKISEKWLVIDGF